MVDVHRMFSLILLGYFFLIVQCDEHTHKYKNEEQVVFWMNTVGPYHNLQETYDYFSLPFCKGPMTTVEHYHENLADALMGIELVFSGLDVRFKVPVEKTEFCQVKLSVDTFEVLQSAITERYWYQMYVDDLSVLGVLGEMREGDQPHLWLHKRFEVSYNGDQIVGVSLTTADGILLTPNTKLVFTYEVIWTESNTPFEDRFNHYLDVSFFQHRIHWFSIFNSFMMVIFLVGLVTMILLRTLRKDYARYNKDDAFEELERELGDEYGWKQVHGDVFRPPLGSLYFSSLVGNGVQLAIVALVVTSLAFVGKVYTERGGLLTTVIFIYALLSPINGFTGGRIYAQVGGKKWIRQLLVGSFLLPTLLCVIALCVNTIALFYQTSRVLPFTSMLAVFAIIVFIIVPLNLVGTVLGRNLGSSASSGSSAVPCRVNSVPRPIPEAKWYTQPVTMSLIGGIIPFGSIFIEMYFIFTSFWAYKVYFVYGFTFLVLIILITVTSCVTIVCTYCLLNAEDYRWQWISFSAGASTAVYVYIYSIYYFLFKTKMFGLFQTVFYFGYMTFFCCGIGCMCGAVGYLASSRFVKRIYSTVKID